MEMWRSARPGTASPRPLSRAASPQRSISKDGRLDGPDHLYVEDENVYPFAHHGYVYCLAMGQRRRRDGVEEILLVSGCKASSDISPIYGC
jgi:hypothetical protein